MNVCKQCGDEKPDEEFYDNFRFKLGLRSVCASCYKELLALGRPPALDQPDEAH